MDVKVETQVVYVDPHGDEHLALVTKVWVPRDPAVRLPSLNLVIVSSHPGEEDQFGRQIKRELAVVHESVQSATGKFWREVRPPMARAEVGTDEEPKARGA